MIVNSIRNSGKQAIFTDVSDVLATLTGKTLRYPEHASSNDWAGTRDMAQALGLLRDGWEHGRNTVDTIVSNLESSLQQVAHDMVQQTMYDSTGAYPDMGRYMEGEPECMVQFVPTSDNTSGQVTRLLIDNGASARYTAEWMTKRAGAVAALVHVLNMVGKSVEVWVASPVDIDGRIHDTVVCVHRAGAPLNVDSIAFTLGHPSMLRRIMFECRADRISGFNSTSMGRTAGAHIQETLDYIQPHVVVQRAENEHGVPCPVASPIEWVKFQLNKLGLLSEPVTV
jgi:hypothetical protein